MIVVQLVGNGMRAAMPDVLTSGKPRELAVGEDLASLAAKVVSGTATTKDKARLKKLAAAL